MAIGTNKTYLATKNDLITNSDITNTILADEIAGDTPELSPLVQAEITKLKSDLTELQKKQVTEEDIASLGFWKETDGKEYVDSEITDLKAQGVQQTPLFANSIEECTDTTKVYVLPDGYIYAYKNVETTGANYTNVLKNTELHLNYRWSHSGKKYSAANGHVATGYLPVKVGDIVYVNLPYNPENFSADYNRFHYFDADKNYVSGHVDGSFEYLLALNKVNDNVTSFVVGYECATYGDDSTSTKLTGADDIESMILVFRRSDSAITEADIADLVVTVNEPIEETTVTGYQWVNTGRAFVPADYEDRIIYLEEVTKEHSETIENLKKGILDTNIVNWDAPIYDTNIPVFMLSTEKEAIDKTSELTIEAVYAKYDALMARNPQFITKSELGLASDGATPIYRYDFREPEPRKEGGKVWSETKAKAIIITGIHGEWGGIYAMYNALEEITENPELFDFRRNIHLIVIPATNPHGLLNYGVKNFNGVEIHRNFEVDFLYPTDSGYIPEGELHYGGTEPLSEVETQYIDEVMKNNTDAAFFLSCHSFQYDSYWGTSFIWASTATKYMCNMGYRLVDKMSKAWMNKYSEIIERGISEYKTENLEDGDTRMGYAGLSTSAGTEAKQATKYGIQGTNVEIADTFRLHGTVENPEPSLSSFTISRGAEVYVNFLLTALGVYDYKDKAYYGGTITT